MMKKVTARRMAYTNRIKPQLASPLFTLFSSEPFIGFLYLPILGAHSNLNLQNASQIDLSTSAVGLENHQFSLQILFLRDVHIGVFC